MVFQLPILYVIGLITVIGILFLLRFLRKQGVSIWFVIPVAAAFIPVSYVDRHFFLLPEYAVWSPFFMVGGTVLVLLIGKGRIPRLPSNLLWFFVTLVSVSVLSALLNDRPLFDIIYTYRGYLVLFSMVIVITHFKKSISVSDLYGILVWSGIASAVIAIFQRVWMVNIFQLGSGDLISALFATDGEFLFFQLTCIIVLLAHWFYGQRVISAPNWLVAIILISSVAIANNKATWGFIIFIFIVIGLFSGFKLLVRNMGTLMLMTLLGLGGYMTFDYFYKQNYTDHKTELGVASYVGDTEFLKYYFFGSEKENSQFSKSGALKRGAAITFAYEQLSESTSGSGLIFGMGPGSTSKFTFADEPGYFERRFPGYKVGRTSLSTYWAELGIVGLLLLGFLAWIVFTSTRRGNRPIERMINRTISILFITYLGYDSLLQEISVMFILAVAIVGTTSVSSHELTET